MTDTGIRMPHTLVILSALIVVVAVASWFISPGRYERTLVDGVERVDPSSYHRVQRNPQGIDDVLMAPIKGFVDASLIIGFVLVVGGSFGVMQRTGAITYALHSVVRAHQRSATVRHLLVPLLMVAFSLGGGVFGMSEEVIPFILVTVPLALALGYDTVTGVAIPFLGAGAGFAGAFLNPFTVGVAQGIAGLPLFSGLGYRLVAWAVCTAVAVLFVLRHASLVRANPHTPRRYDPPGDVAPTLPAQEPGAGLSRRHWLVLGTLVVSFGLLIIGVLKYRWYIQEIAALFLAAGVVAGIAGGLGPNDLVDAFLAGAKDLVGTALVIGCSRGILITAQQGGVVDTLLHSLAGMVRSLHPVYASWAMFVVQTIINFFVPSGSGQAALTMPIMAPLADLVGVSRQTAVLAFQFGDGFTNMIIPTSAVTMGVLSLARIPWGWWARWVLPLEIAFFLLGLALLVPPHLIGWR